MRLSPQGAIALTRAAQAWALSELRDYVIPDDVQAVFGSVVAHRLVCASDQGVVIGRKGDRTGNSRFHGCTWAEITQYRCLVPKTLE